MAINLPETGSSQVLAVSDNTAIPSSSEHHSGSANRKRSRETDEEQSDSEGVEDPDTTDTSQTKTFEISEAGEAIQEATFSKCMDAKSRTQHIEKQGMPNCRWTKCPALNPVVSDNVLKQSGLLPRLKGSICGNQLGKAWYIQRQEMTRNTTIPCTTTFTSVKCNKVCST